jgi:hypothetical protein
MLEGSTLEVFTLEGSTLEVFMLESSQAECSVGDNFVTV